MTLGTASRHLCADKLFSAGWLELSGPLGVCFLPGAEFGTRTGGFGREGSEGIRRDEPQSEEAKIQLINSKLNNN